MGKSFRFMLNFAWINLGVLIGFAAVVIAGCYATGVPGSTGGFSGENLFATYYVMFPLMILFVLYVWGFSLCTSTLNLGLSFGARRGDFFWALQGIMLFYTGVSWVLQVVLCALPAVAGWEVRPLWMRLRMFDGRPWLFPLSCIVFLVLGCLCGLVMIKRKGLGVFFMVLAVLLLMGATLVLILSAETSFLDFLQGSGWRWLIPAAKGLLAALAAAAAGGEVLIWNIVHRFVVR